MSPSSCLLCFEGNICTWPPVGGVLHPLSLHALLHGTFMTPKDTSAFQLLVIYLRGTRVKLEIHLSLPDNNVQNGASCMNHYLQPGVVLLMNIHEASDGKERFVEPVFWRSLRWFCSGFKSGLLEPSPSEAAPPSASQASEHTCSLPTVSPKDGGEGGVHTCREISCLAAHRDT